MKKLKLKLNVNIEESKKQNPPNYGEGIISANREKGKLSKINIVDANGVSLNGREKELENPDENRGDLTFYTEGIRYDKAVMVVEKRENGDLELISGFGRRFWLLQHGIDEYFYDVVKFKNDFWRTMYIRSLNTGDDHDAKGIPNTQGTILKGLYEARDANSFNYRDDDEVRNATNIMTGWVQPPKYIEEILGKFRSTTHSDVHVRALNGVMANTLCKKMELPHRGYCKDASLASYGRIGYTVSSENAIDVKIRNLITLYEEHGQTTIEIFGFVKHVVAENITKQRQKLQEKWEASIAFINSNLGKKYEKQIEKDPYFMIRIVGFHAQLRKPDPNEGAKPIERGIVDVNGNILIDNDQSPYAE